MPDPLTLTIPVDPRYRSLGPEAAGKYVELVGGTTAEGQAVAAAVTAALADIADDVDPGAHADLTLRAQPAVFEVTVSCGSRTRTVSHPRPAA